jgi:hypothetical protein
VKQEDMQEDMQNDEFPGYLPEILRVDDVSMVQSDMQNDNNIHCAQSDGVDIPVVFRDSRRNPDGALVNDLDIERRAVCKDRKLPGAVATISKPAYGVSIEIWSKIDNDELRKAVQSAAMKAFPINGLDEKIWEALDNEDKVRLSALVMENGPKPFRSGVLSFILDSDAVDFDHQDSAMNAMALICALLLTVPYGVIGSLNDSYFSTLEATFAACDNGRTWDKRTFSFEYQQHVQNLTCTVFSSMIGLIFSTIYYLFKPSKFARPPRYVIMKQKILVSLMCVVTTSAVVGIMDLTAVLLNYYTVQFADICTFNPQYLYATGIAFMAFALFVAVILMW